MRWRIRADNFRELGRRPRIEGLVGEARHLCKPLPATAIPSAVLVKDQRNFILWAARG